MFGKMRNLAIAVVVISLPKMAAAVPVTMGLQYHLDASEGVILNGTAVSQWQDQSGNGRDFSQASATKQPLFVASSPLFNNQPVIRFDGDESGAAGNPLVRPNTDALILPSGTNAQTVFIVNNTTRHESLDGVWGINDADKGVRRISSAAWAHPGNADDFTNTGSMFINDVPTANANLNTPHILAGTRSSPLAMPATNIGDYFQVGANAARSWQGEIAEVAVYDRLLTDREIHQVSGSLGLEYNIAVRPGFVVPGLIGGDLTDPEDDGDDSTAAGMNFNAVFRSNNEPHFSQNPLVAPSNEAAFDVFDNKEGPAGGENKWCCDSPAQFQGGLWVEADFGGDSYILDQFTLTSSNDSPDRDPLAFSILGSNDGMTYEEIFGYDAEFGNLFTDRNQTLVFEAGVDYELPTTAYSIFRYNVLRTGGGAHALGEIEFFGTLEAIPEPMTAMLGMIGLAALARRRRRLA